MTYGLASPTQRPTKNWAFKQEKKMKDLIEALTIFQKYLDGEDNRFPTKCENDEMRILDVDPKDVSPQDHIRLDALGFYVTGDGYMSHRFGSA